MESLTPLSTYISRSAKKRVFTGGSSSSRCKEVDVLGISSPAPNGSSIPKSSKQEEVICHEIKDSDWEDARGNGLLNDTGGINRNGKDKEPMSNFLADHGSLATNGSGSDVYRSDNSIVDDSNSNLFYGEDEWIDTYYDDIVFDDYDVLQSHYDRMDIPPGVEMPFPWLPDYPQNVIMPPVPPVPSVSTSSSLRINSNSAKPSTNLSSSPPLVEKESGRFSKFVKPLSSLRATQSVFQQQHLDMIPSTSPMESGSKKFTSPTGIVYRNSESSPGGSLRKKGVKGSFELGKTKRRFMGSHLNSGPYRQVPTGSLFLTAAYNASGSTTSLPGPTIPGPVHHCSFLASGSQSKPPGVGTYTTGWEGDMPMNMFEPPTMFSTMNESAYFLSQHTFSDHQNGEIPMRFDQKNLDEILRKFDGFKKFDTVEDCSDHHYYKQSSFSIQTQPRNRWAKKIQEEWKILENDLPDKIFVRVYESRMDLLRAVIIGADETPYHDGLFFFDICFPIDYPDSPPHVQYRSGGLRINPNLYKCGKVCLSLLNTWSGNNKERWIPGVSTILQVLVSIQGLILNAKPFFNEPGFSGLFGSKSGEKQSLDYNERTFIYSLQTMVYTIRKPPKYFEDFVIGHFCKCGRDILLACEAYLYGVQVGSLVKEDVQDVNMSNKSCSLYFKSSLAGFITTLVDAFSKTGAKDCDQFLALAKKGGGNPTAVPSKLIQLG